MSGWLATAKRKAGSARFHTRAVLGRGSLPNSIIIGAAKCGTTSLFAYLAQHPEVCVSRLKELRFFDRQWEKGPRWYRANFTPRRGQRIILEASPNYLIRPHTVIPRMLELLTEPRLIVMLREPIARAYSQFNDFRSMGIETLSFDDALRLEGERQCSFSYCQSSTYAPHLEEWLRYFPREQFIFIKSEDLFASPRAVFDDVVAQLGISRDTAIDFAPRNQHQYEVPAEATELLEGAFTNSNARIKELTGIEWR